MSGNLMIFPGEAHVLSITNHRAKEKVSRMVVSTCYSPDNLLVETKALKLSNDFTSTRVTTLYF